jgi:ActR/RegA family two-component response regulator
MTVKKDPVPPIAKQQLLFVDDEEGVRLTLPAILQNEGFEVTVAASVPEALEMIGQQSFDVLLTDLNIGGPADGFILVSAMRRVQPKAATFILTGYPDFHTALEAIRKQVDDYFIKPADIPTLVSTLREKTRSPRICGQVPCKRVSEIVRENADEIAIQWIKEVKADSRLAALKLSDEQRSDRLPDLLKELAKALETNGAEIPSESLTTAAIHGAHRAEQGYTIPLMLSETRILNRVIASVLHQNLMSLDLSTLFPHALRIGEYLQGLLEESIRAFQAAEHQQGQRRMRRAGNF